MSELAVLGQRALVVGEEVLAHLSLVLLLQSVELTLIAVEVVEVALLGQVSHYLAWWIVEVLLGLSVGVQLSSVSTLALLVSRVGKAVVGGLNLLSLGGGRGGDLLGDRRLILRGTLSDW